MHKMFIASKSSQRHLCETVDPQVPAGRSARALLRVTLLHELLWINGQAVRLLFAIAFLRQLSIFEM